jgi:hypothetical protein
MRTDTQTLIDALRILVRDIESEDGVANACIAEAADRLQELITPQWYYTPDGPDITGDFDDICEYADLQPGGILRLIGVRDVNVVFAANVPVPDEDDGQYKLFATKEEAEKATEAGKTAA